MLNSKHVLFSVVFAASGLSPASAQVEPTAGSWRTWVVGSGRELRLPPPPNAAATRAEAQQLRALAGQRDTKALELVRHWDSGAPAYRWNELAVQQALKHGVGGARAARALALLHVAVYDATVAAWNTKYAYRRLRPSRLQPALKTAIPVPDSPAYPSEHAVAAGAASAVLSALFPNDAALFQAQAQEAGRSRLLAGTDYPSDVAAGLELGRTVAAKVLERAKTDGSDARWTGTVPNGPGKWIGTTPIDPLVGTWKTWALTSGSQFRPGPPPAPGSEQMARELAEVKDYKRTNLSNVTASYWEYYGGRAYFEFYTQLLGQKLFESHLDRNPPRAARAYALQAVALHDQFAACWDAKYTYWQIRPAQLDPTITPVFTTPNHPAYPSAHSTIAGTMETVLGYLFPADAAQFARLSEAANWSRLWAGIHFRSDIEVGRALGRQVAGAVIERARQDGSDGPSGSAPR